MNPTNLQAQLAQFTGSRTFTRHGLARSMVMTEGVIFLADAASAHWLTDAIASYIHDPRSRREAFQVWHLVVDPSDRSAGLAMTDGNDPVPIVAQDIRYTDFPLNEITLWLVADGRYRVLMLPSEY